MPEKFQKIETQTDELIYNQYINKEWLIRDILTIPIAEAKRAAEYDAIVDRKKWFELAKIRHFIGC